MGGIQRGEYLIQEKYLWLGLNEEGGRGKAGSLTVDDPQ
jgi:hypothetical protein